MTTTGAATPAAGAPAGLRPVSELPVAVRQRVIEWAAEALGAASPTEIPPTLTRFARFAPNKRAKLAANALALALQTDVAFRAMVAARAMPLGDADPGVRTEPTNGPVAAESGVPGPATAKLAGPERAAPEPASVPENPVASYSSEPGSAAPENVGPGSAGPGNVGPENAGPGNVGRDNAGPGSAGPENAVPAANVPEPVSAAARAYLLRLPEEDELLRAVADAARHSDARARVTELEREVRGLTARLERTAAELAAKKTDPTVQRAGAGDEAERLRLRLREQGTRIRELQQQVDGGAARAAQLVAEAQAERDRSKAEAESWRLRAEAATVRAETAVQGLQRMRASAGDSRAASDRRLELLLGALEGAASGLRREWDLIGGGLAPADVVAARLPRPAIEAERTSDPARLTAWAGLPGAHLIVDGYNVTKTGFAELSLSDQRDRLVRSLGAFAARTSAEVTVVFDGAAVASARPPARGIRVLFSPAGVIADDVIRELVRAEPKGRVVVVVSSDREVADRAAADGAKTAGSTVLLAAFGS